MGAIASQITSLGLVCSTVYAGADQRKNQSSASLAFVRGIHRWPVNSPHKWPVTRKMFQFDEVINDHEVCRFYCGNTVRVTFFSRGSIIKDQRIILTNCDLLSNRSSVSYFGEICLKYKTFSFGKCIEYGVREITKALICSQHEVLSTLWSTSVTVNEWVEINIYKLHTRKQSRHKIWWLCLVPTSTPRFASDVGYRMTKI